MSDDTTLWALHIEGPDDFYAMPSKAAAQAHADILNRFMAQGKSHMKALVALWPHSAEAHAENMQRHLKDFQ